jgi:hypothetical protein
MKYVRRNKKETHDMVLKSLLDEVIRNFNYETYRGDAISVKTFVLLAVNVQLLMSSTINVLSMWLIYISIVSASVTLKRIRRNYITLQELDHIELNKTTDVRAYQGVLLDKIIRARMGNQNIHNDANMFYNLSFYCYLLALFIVVIMKLV